VGNVAVGAIAWLLGTGAHAQTDEIQVYDADINNPGQFSLQLHSNYTPIGRRQADFKGGIVPNRTLNGVPEWAYGVTDWLELGAYVPVYSWTGSGLGFQVTTNGVDPHFVFNNFVIAYGGRDIVTKDGKLHLDDPKVKEAVIKAMTYPTAAYKEGFVPPSAINWNDADDNNAFHAKQIVMDLDGTLSTEVAIFNKKEDYDDIVTMGLPLSNDGKPVPSSTANGCGLIPKGAKNVAVAKDFLKYFIQPTVSNEWLKTGLGRSTPCMQSIVKDDPWWFADPHRAAYTKQVLLDPTLPQFWVFNPAYAQVQTEHVWATGWMDVIQGRMTPQAAAEKAFKRVEEIFAKYPIAQG
jgi:multiple sugar transport system substrate-binding protein